MAPSPQLATPERRFLVTTPARRAPVLALELGGGAHPAAPRDAARPVRAWAAAAEA
ncbi:hypothetical protein, partial [Streptacidiphilus monticola]